MKQKGNIASNLILVEKEIMDTAINFGRIFPEGFKHFSE